MSCATKDLERLNDFADGLLDGDARTAVEAHLSGCGECREEIAAMMELRAEARALPGSIEPAADLWPAIEARIRRRVIPIGIRRPGVVGVKVAWLAAAAVTLIALSSGATAYLLRGGDSPAALPPAAARPAVPATFASMRPVEQEYQGAVESLLVELERRRGRLSPETMAVIEENLRIIDQAIAESRAALKADPASPELPLMLSDAYRKKVELLEHAVQLTVST